MNILLSPEIAYSVAAVLALLLAASFFWQFRTKTRNSAALLGVLQLAQLSAIRAAESPNLQDLEGLSVPASLRTLADCL